MEQGAWLQGSFAILSGTYIGWKKLDHLADLALGDAVGN